MILQDSGYPATLSFSEAPTFHAHTFPPPLGLSRPIPSSCAAGQGRVEMWLGCGEGGVPG